MKKKGFTLIELMIVLAIIAILAVVLIPKSGIFKNNSKNAGVITNVNTVRAYLETKITSNNAADAYLSKDDLDSALTKAFTTGSNSDKLANPLDSSKSAYSIVDKTIEKIDDEEGVKTDASVSGKKGQVVVVVYEDGYGVLGVDSGEAATQAFIIK